MNPGDSKEAHTSITSRGRPIKMPQHLRDFEISQSGEEDVDLETMTWVTITPEGRDRDRRRVAMAAHRRKRMSRPPVSSAPAEGAHTRPAHLVLPTCLRLAESSLRDRVGVFAAAPLPVGLRLGPYGGLADCAGPGRYSWRVRHGRLVDDGDKAHSNWMRFVNCTPDADSRNLTGFQHHGALYFRTVAPVAVGAELFVYYGDDYASSVDADGYYDYIPSKEESDSEFAATDDGGGDGDAGDDDMHIDYWDYRPPKEEPEPLELGDGEAGDDYGPSEADDYGSFEEDPESKVIDIYHHLLKEEPKPELGDGDGEAVDVNGCYDCDPVKKEPETGLTTDDDVTDSGRVADYDCSPSRISLSTPEFRVQHELRCKVQMKQKEPESQVTKLYQCRYCTYPFQNKELEEQHQRNCPKKPGARRRRSKGTYYKCDKCEYVTKDKRNFESHILNHADNVEWLTCKLCSYKTVHKSVMIRHMKIHGIIFSRRCPICGKSFKTKQNLDDHLVRQHSDKWEKVSELITNKIYTCNICDRFRTTSKTDFNQHLTVTHFKGVGCQKYECPRCPYFTFRKYYLKRHAQMHVRQTDYQCTVCKKQFLQKRDLDSHILDSHADSVDLVKTITSKIHRCGLCSFKTVDITKLKEHVRSNHF